MDSVELVIQSLSKKGHGKAPWKQKSVEVPGALPGERILIESAVRGSRRKLGKLLQILSPSPHRVAARCSHADICGGCSFQPMDYAEQLRYKREKLEALFSQSVEPVIGCDLPYYGRNKMEYTFSQNKAGEKFLGLIMKGTRGHVFNMAECHLTSAWFMEALEKTRHFWEESGLMAYHSHQDKGHLRTLTLRESVTTKQKMAMLTVSGNPEFALTQSAIALFKEALLSTDPSLSLFIRIQQIQKGVPTQFYEMHLNGPATIQEKLVIRGRETTFEISPTSFFQPNTGQAIKLFTKAIEMVQLTGDERLFDLYCGTGTISQLMAPYIKEGIGIELNPYAVLDAQENAQKNGFNHLTYIAGDVGEKLAELVATPPDIVVVDPPRSGLSPTALKHLLSVAAPRILYISCNPDTLKENCDTLAVHYEILTLQPVDQFPHSPHVEMIALLARR